MRGVEYEYNFKWWYRCKFATSDTISKKITANNSTVQDTKVGTNNYLPSDTVEISEAARMAVTTAENSPVKPEDNLESLLKEYQSALQKSILFTPEDK